MPKVRNDQTGPWPVAIQEAVYWAHDLNLPGPVIERLRSPIVAPTPLLVLRIVEECVELIRTTCARIGEPSHGD